MAAALLCYDFYKFWKRFSVAHVVFALNEQITALKFHTWQWTQVALVPSISCIFVRSHDASMSNKCRHGWHLDMKYKHKHFMKIIRQEYIRKGLKTWSRACFRDVRGLASLTMRAHCIRTSSWTSAGPPLPVRTVAACTPTEFALRHLVSPATCHKLYMHHIYIMRVSNSTHLGATVRNSTVAVSNSTHIMRVSNSTHLGKLYCIANSKSQGLIIWREHCYSVPTSLLWKNLCVTSLFYKEAEEGTWKTGCSGWRGEEWLTLPVVTMSLASCMLSFACLTATKQSIHKVTHTCQPKSVQSKQG